MWKRNEPLIEEVEKPSYISPCIGVCKLDKDKICIGCGRTIEDIKKAGSINTQA
jgi:predicted Fe-S protein YdhL (DUF1289 family)